MGRTENWRRRSVDSDASACSNQIDEQRGDFSGESAIRALQRCIAQVHIPRDHGWLMLHAVAVGARCA